MRSDYVGLTPRGIVWYCGFMGRASREKFERRLTKLKAEVAALQQDRQTPFWEQNLFWGPVGIAVSIIIAVLAIMTDVRWLLIVAWPFLILGVWVATRDIVSSPKRTVCILGVSMLAAVGHFMLYNWLQPSNKFPNAGEIADEIARRFPTEKPRAQMIITRHLLRPLVPNQPVRLNIYFLNVCILETETFEWHALIKIIASSPSGTTRLKLEDELFEELRNSIEATKKERLTNIVPVGRENFVTVLGPSITADEIKELQSGKSRLYLLAKLIYSDKTGSYETNFCMFDQGTERLARIACSRHNDAT